MEKFKNATIVEDAETRKGKEAIEVAKYRKIVAEGENEQLKNDEGEFRNWMIGLRPLFQKRGWDELFEILFREHQSHKFLGHGFFGPDGRQIMQKLFKGEDIVPGEELYDSHETAFCMHGPSGAMVADGDYGLFRRGSMKGGSLGFAVFNDSLYEKISSPEIPEHAWDEIVEVTRSLYEIRKSCSKKIGSLTWEPSEEELKRYYEEQTSRYLEGIDRIYGKIKKIYGMDLREYVDNGNPDAGERFFHVNAAVGALVKSIASIGCVRNGGFYTNYHDFFTGESGGRFGDDVGIRAVELTKDGEIIALPLERKDIKYLVITGAEKKKYKMLIAPKEQEGAPA